MPLRLRKEAIWHLVPIGIFSFACLAYGMVVAALFKMLPGTASVFFLVQVFVVFVPGYALSIKLVRQTTLLNRIALAYALGYCINLIEYFVSYGLGFHQTFIIAIAAVGVSAAALLLSPSEDKLAYDGGDVVAVFIWVLYVAVCIVAYSGNDISPFANGMGTSIARDIQYWASNAVALKLGFPPSFTFMDGTVLQYHYFSSMHTAFLSQTSGLTVFDLSFPLFPFGKSILLVGAVNFLSDAMRVGKAKWFFLVLALFTTGFEPKSVVTYVWHTLTGPFGCDIGLALGVFFIALLIRQWKTEQPDYRNMAALLLIWFALVGTKAPIATILIFAAAVICIAWVFLKRRVLGLLYGASVLSIFFLVNVFVVDAFRRVAEGSTTSLSRFYDIGDLPGAFTGVDGVDLVFATICKAFLTQPVVYMLIGVAIVVMLVARRRGKAEEGSLPLSIALLLSCSVGCVAGTVCNIGGHSEMYYSIAALIPAWTYIMNAFSLLPGLRDGTGKFALASNTALAPLAVFGVCLFCFVGFTPDYSLAAASDSGSRKILRSYEFSTENFFGIDEANAADWIRANAPQNALVATDRSSTSGQESSYYYGIFSERQQYMEAGDLLSIRSRIYGRPDISVLDEACRRRNLVVRACTNDDDALRQLVEEGVDYLICNSELSPNVSTGKLLNLEYSSGPISVYSTTL